MSNTPPKRIAQFDGQYRFLSNFSDHPVTYAGLTFKNSEAAFHAMKCPSRAAEFTELSPSQAKQLGRKVKLRLDWETVKDAIMHDIVKAKFSQDDELRVCLLSTGDAYLEEGNTWGDRYWGTVDGVGKNMLGKILMQVRDELFKG
ncbi:NADAR family protein [uncultured Duncaniella sp.]|uniref:NADAR family protein n=1 Tax=uncultured Duncaniella sp. TaxID=2768039 RepID=UPI0026335B77|nr:NADAR family protein [uncultured Duncaniella sp.]